MANESKLKKTLLNLVLILVVGGIGGVLIERAVLPYLATLSFFKNFGLLSRESPIVITKREEIRINEGINQQDIANRARNSLVTVYFYSGDLGSVKFRQLGQATGVILTSDGVIAVPLGDFREDVSVAVSLPGTPEVVNARFKAIDALTGLAFLKVEKRDLAVVKPNFSRELKVGDKIAAVWGTSLPKDVAVVAGTVSARSIAWPGLLISYI